jgi:surface antigen
MAFGEALDRRLSGATLTWANPASGSSGSVTPLRTFQTADGRWCREFEARVDAPVWGERRVGIACREGERWRLELERPGEA